MPFYVWIYRQADKFWEPAVTDDFADRRRAGVTSPLTDAIERDYAEAPAAVP